MLYLQRRATYSSRCKHLTLQTKLSRVTFVVGLSLMALCCCMAEASMGAITVTGVTGSVLALGSMWWTGWGDW